MEPKRKRRVLIIDDEATFARLLQLNLEQTGSYTVRAESQPANALAVAKEFRPDIILCDVVMPDLDGGEVATQIKREAELHDTPIVFLTAVISREEVIEHGGMIAGNTYLAKPATTEEVIHCIERHAA